MKEKREQCLRILVISNNFLIGGRETFLKCYIESLRKKLNVKVGLLTSYIDGESNKDIFDDVYLVEGNGDKPELNFWLKSGHDAIRDLNADILWVHHYCLLPAWLLSVHHKISLLCTFHGSLFNQGYLYHDDQLGLACILKYGGGISAVSHEIIDEINNISNANTPKADISLLSNAVIVPNKLPLRLKKEKGRLHVVVFTRQQKLGHIRASVLLFAKFNSIFPKSKLTIYTGQFLDDGRDAKHKKSLFTILGRKWVMRNLVVLTSFKYIEIRSLCKNVQSSMIEADIVFGMGRVALEGIACNKPTVLVGYNKPVSFINANNFMSLQYSNFSGRKQVHQSIDYIVEDLASHIKDNRVISTELIEKVNIEKQTSRLLKIIDGLQARSYTNLPADFMKQINSIFSKINDDDFELAQDDLRWLKGATSKHGFEVEDNNV